VAENLAQRLSSIGALAEPARRELYLYVVAQPEPVGRDEVATQTGYPRHVVKFHLDRLVDEGLLEVEFRRLTGRRGPGAGRPAKLYRRAQDEIAVSLPERHYDLAGQILADALQEVGLGQPVQTALAQAARAAGHRIAAGTRAATTEPISAEDILSACGYEPRSVGDETHLVNCPFHSLALEHTELICGMNLELVAAMAEEAGLDNVVVRLDAAPGRCCVTLHSASRSR
jgi:predicted ArsR family transcriptional regulator